MGGTTISTSEPRLANIRVQTSSYGLVIPLIYGRARVPGNLGWYGNFNAIAHTTVEEAGGKGGGVSQSSTVYTYEAAVIMFLGHGPINGVPSAWRGKERLAGLTVAGKTRTLSHTAVVPGGGVVTVAESGIYSAPVKVERKNLGSMTWDEYEQNGGFLLLTEGTDFTRAGGVYTFVAEWVGETVLIQYQVQDAQTTLSALGQLGLSLATGTPAQPVWSWLNSYDSAQSLSYSGFAYTYAQNYPLEDSAQLPNHNFEVSTPWERPDLGTTDAHPADIVEDLLLNPVRGVGWSIAGLASLTPYRDYCTAHGLFMSPVLDTQRTAIDWIKGLLELTNSDIVYSGSQIKIVPLGDENATGNGATFTANTTPEYDLGIDDFVTSGNAPRIRIRRNSNDDVRGTQGNDVAHNVITLEIENRDNGYASEPVSAEDLASMEEFGRRPADSRPASAIKSVAVGRAVAQLLLQKEQGRRAQYEFTLWANRSLLEPLDLVTLTDADVGLDRWPVRLISIEERDAHSFDVVAEDAPIGMASAPAYGVQAGSGFFHDYNAAPGNVLTPVVFEAPGALTATGLELMVATAGGSANWGGCQVWISYDGTHYRQVGKINGGSRYGTLTAAISGGNLPVSIHGGQLLSGSAADLAALATLCYIGGATPEFLAYQTATLTSTNAYTLSTLSRGAYGSATNAHSIGEPFVRVDSALFRSGPLDAALVGTTVYIKLTSFNLFGGGQQSLADVSPYTYAITGAWIYGNAGAAALLGITSAASDDILSAGEKPPVILDYTQVTAEQTGIDAQATAYGITTEKTAYDSAVSALTAYLATLTSPVAWNSLSGDTVIVGTTFRAAWAALYAARQTLLNKIDASAKALADAAQSSANTAITNAATAQSAANTANSALANIASDSILSPSEKPSVVQDYAVITAEQTGIDAQATAYNITTEKTAYDNAVSALTSYLGGLSGWNTVPGSDVAIVGTTFRANFAAVYTARQALLNKIAAVAGTIAAWSGVSGAGKPADNASSDIALAVSGAGLILSGNSCDRPTGGGAWDAQCYSVDGYTGGAFCSFVPNAGANSHFMAGLNTDPLTDASYPSIDYAFYMTPGSPLALAIYESGDSPGTVGTYALGDVLAVTYDGINVRYLQNGTVLRTVAASAGLKFYFDSSIVSSGLNQIRCGPLTSISDVTAAAAAAQGTANTAITNAATAQSAANTANSALANIASDSILSPSEKPSVVQDYAVITAEQTGIDAQATAYNITTEKTAYDNAVSALTSYLGGLSGWNTVPGSDVAIVGTTFRANFAAVYTARQALLNKIAAVAGTIAAWSGVSGAGKPASYATVGKSLALPFESWALNGQALVAVSDGKVGGTALRLSGISSAYPNQNNLVPIDRTKTYRTRFWARPSSDNAAGHLYFSLYQFISPGVGGPINGGRSPYKPSAITRAAHNSQFGGTDQWGEYSYLWTAADWQTGVQFVLPEFLDNYPIAAGHWDIQDFTFEEVTEVTAAQSAADAAASAASAAQASANTANAELANIASDSILSPSEKPSVVQDYAVITAEQTGIDAQATAYSITTEKTAYDNAVSALTSYLDGLSGWNTVPGSDVAMVGATFRANFAAVYTARQALLNKIAAVAGTIAAWSGVSGAGKPADNASSDIALTVSGAGLILSGNSCDRPTGGGAWDAQCYSVDGYTGGAFCSFVPNAGANSHFMAGLNTDPLTDASYPSIDYAFYMTPGSPLALAIYESGSNPGTFGTYAPGDVLAVTYDGINVRYLQNGTVLRTVAASAGLKFYFDSSIVSSGLNQIRFGPLTSISDVTAAAAAASAAAAAAQSSANTANTTLAEISSDSLLTPDEKPRVIMDRDVIVAEQSDIDAKATAQGITTLKTTYDTAVSALTTYLATLTSPVAWDSLAGNTTINGSTFRGKFSDVYAARQALMNSIAVTIASGAVGTGHLASNAATENFSAYDAAGVGYSNAT